MTATTILDALEQSETNRSPRPRTQAKQKTDAGPARRRDRRAAALQLPRLSGAWLPPRDDTEVLREEIAALVDPSDPRDRAPCDIA